MAAVEEVFFAVNAKSALKLSRNVRALAPLADRGRPRLRFANIPARGEIKSVVSYGRAEKAAGCRKMVGVTAAADNRRLNPKDARRCRWLLRSAMLRRRLILALEDAGLRLMKRSATLLLATCAAAGFCAFAQAASPRALTFSKSFPGSTPPWEEITVDRSGAGQYKEDPK